MTTAFLETGQGSLQHFSRARGDKLFLHHVTNAGFEAVLSQRDEQIRCLSTPTTLSPSTTGKSSSETGHDKVHGLGKVIVRLQSVEFGDHDRFDGNAVQCKTHLHHAGLLSGAEPDKQCDKNQERVAKEAGEPE